MSKSTKPTMAYELWLKGFSDSPEHGPQHSRERVGVILATSREEAIKKAQGSGHKTDPEPYSDYYEVDTTPVEIVAQFRCRPMEWSQKHTRLVDMDACPVCGKHLKAKGRWQVYVYGYSKVVHPDDIEIAKANPYDGADGPIEIGPECRKKFGEFAYRVPE